MELTEIVERVRTWATGRPEIQAAYIYGSRVKGTHRPDSDLDICVQLDLSEIPNRDTEEAQRTLAWMDHQSPWQEELQSFFPYTVHLELYEPEHSKRVGTGEMKTAYQKP